MEKEKKMNASLIERETTKGYEELVVNADLNKFTIENLSKTWTNIITDGYDSEIVLRNVSAKDIVAYLDSNNTLYIARKGSISYLLKEYSKYEQLQSVPGSEDIKFMPNSGGISLPCYDPVVLNIYLEDKKGVVTKLDITSYLEQTTQKVNEFLATTQYKDTETLLIYADSKTKNKLLNIYKNEPYNLDITGTELKNSIKGGNGSDVINANGGNDKIWGLLGNDTLYGGAGNDTIDGGDGDDILYGGADNDKLYGKDGNDILYGEAGNDRLSGGDGNDTLYGGEGNDTIYGGYGDDIIYGGAGDDRIYGERGFNTIVFTGNGGFDTVYSGKGEDTLYFEDFSDYADANIQYMKNGKHLVIGYGGLDENGNPLNTITLANYLKSPTKSSIKYLDFGEDHIRYNIYEEALLSFTGNPDKSNKITGTSIRDFIVGGEWKDTLKGGSGDDEIYGNGGNDKIYGDNGNDSLYGGAGNDTIKGGANDDYIEGGLGDDRIYGGSGINKVVFRVGDGNDYVYLDKKGVSNLVFENADVSKLSYDKDGNHLIVKYSDTDSVTIVNYFKTKNAADLLGGKLLFGNNESINLSEIVVPGQLQPNGTYSYIGTDKTSSIITTTTKKTAYVNTGNGNNTVFLNSSYGTVEGGNGNDTIYIKGSNTKVLTNEGNDTIYINSTGNFVDAGSGNNTIYINKTSEVIGGEDKDTYAIKNLSFDVDIKDLGGTNDEVIIGEKRSNINFVYNVQIDEDGQITDNDASNDLYIVSDKVFKNISKSLGKGTLIEDYFTKDESGKNGGIEHIYSKDGYTISLDDINMVKQQVAFWLYNNNYGSTDEVFASGNKEAISSILAIYQNADNYWSTGSTNIEV